MPWDRFAIGWRPLAALLAAVVLAAAGSACGSDDGDGDGGGSASAQSQDSGADAATTEEIESAFATYASGMKDTDWEQVCASYSDAYQKQVAKETQKLYKDSPLAKDAPAKMDCVDAMKLSMQGVVNPAVATFSKVKSTDGTTALVVIRSSSDNTGTRGPVRFLPFTKENGEWKVDGPGRLPGS